MEARAAGVAGSKMCPVKSKTCSWPEMKLAAVFCLACVVAAATKIDDSLHIPAQVRADADKIINAALNEGPFVFNRLAYITDTFGPRFSGTQALETVIDWIKQTQISDGLFVTEEPCMIPKWVRGNEYANMLQPRFKPLHMIGLGMSSGTNGKPIRAEVLVVKSFDELKNKSAQAKGKIVLYNEQWTNYGDTVAYRYSGAATAATYGALGVLVRAVAPFGIQTPHTGSSQTASIPAAGVSIEDAAQMQRMQDRGQKIVVELYMEAHQEADVPSRNLIIQINGTDFPNEYVIFGGHMDSWDNAEGAMDDGGGFSVSWEAIRLIQSLGLKPRRTIRAIMYVNEENGERGGIQYAKDHAAEANFTSIAIETDSGTFTPFRLGFSGNSNQALAILTSMGSQLLSRIGAGNVTTGGSGADISNMCALGVPCAGLEVLDPRVGPYTNNPCLGFQSGGQTYQGEIPDGYFWYHHTAADTMDKLDPTQLQLSAAAMAVWAYGIASLDTILPRT